MTQQVQPASADELGTFLEKLAQFHATLSPREQAILDEMTAMSLITPSAEVQGYTNVPTIGPLVLNAPVSSQYYYYYSGVQQYYRTLLPQ
jgi:hypothetical protein